MTGVRLTPDFFVRVEQIGQARELLQPARRARADVRHSWAWVMVVALTALWC